MATTILDNTWKPDKPQTISLEEYENVEVNTVDLIKHVRNRKKSKKVRLAVRPRAVSTEPRVEDMTEATRNIYQTGSVDIARRRPLDASSEYKKKERVSGSRKTIFTNIASVSCLSHNAAIVRQNLQGFFSVRVEPSIASILDYEPGSRHKRSIVLKNYSATVQKVTLHPPQTKLFRLAGKSTKNMDSFLIAPGLDTSIEIEFLAPLSTSSPPMVPPNTATPRSNGKRVVGQNVTGTSKMPLTRNYQKLQPLMLDLEDSEVSMGLPLTTKTQHIEPSKQRGLSVFAPPPILSSAITAATQPDPSSRLYEDILGVEIHGTESKIIHVPIQAYPAGPRLKFKREVDFGVVVHGLVGNDMKEKASDKDSQWDRYGRTGEDSKQPKAQGRSGGNDASGARPQVAFEVVPQALQAKGVDLGEPIAVDYLEFRNVGKRTARFRILPSNSKTRLKITPDYLTLGIPEGGQGQLGLPDTAMVKVELFYSGVGRFSEEVRVELENPTPVVSERSEIDGQDMDSLDSIGETPLVFHVSATVVNHKLRLRNQDNTSDIDPKHLNFGVIYYSQRACLQAKLENRGPTVLRWVITHAGESAPMVPSSYRGKLVGNGGSNHGNAGLSDMTNGAASQADAENKASMAVVPSEGILNPYQTSDIVFNFAPRVQDPIVGFKVTRAGPPTHLFKVPMQLKIITSAVEGSDTARKASLAGNQVGEEPIDIVMTGKACPIEATLSSNQMHFEDVVMGKSSETTKEVVLKNDSDQLGYRFRFTTAAHFHTYPSVGHLGPLESINVKVVFKPNQLGHFSTKLQCIISSSDDVPTFESALLGPGKVPLLVKFAGDHKSRDICNLPLSLKGCFRPSGSLESEPFSKFEEVRKIGSNLKHRNSNSGTLLMQADMEEGKIARTIHLEKDCQNLGHRRSLSEGEQKAHEDWLEKTSNRHQYWDYLKQSRVNRLFEERKRRFGDDGVSIQYDKLLDTGDGIDVDIENGLSPPEPTDFMRNSATTISNNKVAISTTDCPPEDTRKIRMLFQQLYEPTVVKPKISGNGGSNEKAVPIDVPLTGPDLANIFTASSALDFGEVTVHSVNTLPLNFLNVSPNRLPIHIRLLVDKDGRPDSITESDSSWELRVSPSSLVLQPMSVSGVEVTFKSHCSGKVLQKITYLVNGRYKYQLPVKVKVNPIQLSLSTSKLLLEVPQNFTGLLSQKAQHMGAGNFEDLSSKASSELTKYSKTVNGLAQMPHSQETVILYNYGNFSAGFQWHRNADTSTQRESHPALNEGSFFLEPTTGSIPPKGSIEIKVVYIPGVKPVYEESINVRVVDEAAVDDANRISSELTLTCRGEISTANCVLLTSVKQGPLDLGILPVMFKDNPETDTYLSSYNVFGVHDLFPENSLAHSGSGPQVSAKALAGAQKSGPIQALASGAQSSLTRGWRTVRIKNTSVNTCFFIAQLLKNEAEVEIYPRSGAIQGSGGILELTLMAVPTKVSLVEDAVLVTIIGGGKVMKIPFKYESREPVLELTANPLKIPANAAPEEDDADDEPVEIGTVIGSWSVIPLIIANVGTVAARGVVDLRTYAEFEFSIKGNKDEISLSGVGPTSASTGRASSAQAKKAIKQQAQSLTTTTTATANREAFKIITPDDDLYNFSEVCFKKILVRPGSPRRAKRGFEKLDNLNEDPVGNIFVFELQAGERVNAELVYRPKATKKYSFDLPIRIIGMSSVPKIHVDTQSVPSPITVSKTSVNFKNKVVFRDLGIMGVSHLKNVAKEYVSITNNSERRISWSFDVDPLEEQESAYKLDPWHGSLEAGATQNINISFQPERIGLFETQLPLHIDYMGRHAPFVLSLHGTGVEPSIAFEPNEIFLPIVPLGMETTSTFSIVNYGCERTEIKHFLSEEAMSRYGQIELQFPEGKLLKSDGEKLTVVVRFIGHTNLAAANQARMDSGEGQSEGRNVENNKAKICGPVSFTTKIEFSDNNHRTFYLSVHGTSDNSLLTLLPYFWRTRTDFKFAVADTPGSHLAYLPKKAQAHTDENQRRTRILNGPRPFRTPSGIPLENGDMDAVDLFLGQTGESLVRRLEDHLSPGMSAMEFPSQFTSNPKALAELIQSISSKKIPTFQGQSQLQSQSTQERSKAIQKYFKEMLNLMISAGAFVSCVKPEFLMSHEDYRRIVNSQMDVLKSDNKGIVHDEMVEYNKKLDSIFPIIQKEAWLTVLLQIVKVYVTSMVTVKHFRALPGLERDEMDMEWPINSKSNVFSTAEYVLLRWSSYHMWKRAGIKKRLTNFTDDFKNSVPIASLILSHIPHLESTNFAYFHPLCETSEQLEENCRIINGALSVIFNTNSILLPVDQVVRGEAALDIQLLLLFLYQTLPHFLPKALVEFHGGLHDKVIRSIEISNPSGRALSYTAHLGGSPDFTLVEGSTLSVAPKSQSKMPLLFASRFATRVEGQVKLQTRKMGLNSASILVFDLVGSVEPPTPRRMFKIDAPMYCTPPNTVDLEITSPFAVTGRFKVSLRQHHRVAPLLLLHKGRSPTEISCPEDASFFDTFSPPAFKALENELVIEPNQSRFLPIAFQPFDSGIHECTLHFVDEAVGEFIYQIDGRATAPQAIDFVWTCKAASSLEKPIRITPVNPIREKALYSVLQKRQLKGIGKKKSLTSGQLETDRDSFQTPRRPLKYKVEYLSPYFSGPAEITIRPASDVVKEKKTLFELDQNYTELPILFKPKLPGKYSCKIVLMGTEVSDVRVFFIQGVAISEGSKAELDFNTPVRQTLTQDIPIVNKTDEDWTIKASLQGNFFSGPHALVAPAHAVTNYTITFKPMRPTEVEGMLTMSNLHTAQKHVYYLRGVGQEPLPEEHREIKCSVRDKVRETFKVTNYTDQDAEYDVVTDIPNTTCLHRLFVPSGQSVDHTLEIHAKKSGQFTQLVTYVNRSDGSYVWYTCRMVVRPPPCEETIRMTTTVRKAVAIEIPIHNPLDEAVTFDVMYTGEGLVGSHKFKVEGKSEALYAMSYAPISSAVESGKLTFQNEFVGEFWYDLQLEAKEAPPIMLPDMSAPLGKCSAQIVTIQNIFPNPTRLEIFLNEGSTDFQVNYPPMTHLKDIARKPRSTQTVIVSLKPMERADVQLVFWPSSLTEPRTSILHVLSTTLGNSTYHVQGMGVLPEPMDEIIIRGQLNHSVSGILSFTNPLLDPIPVSITIKNDDVTAMSGTPDITLMIHKKPRYNVGGLERLDIPFVYTPKKMDRAIVSVIVEMGKLKWVYPVTGMPDAPITTSTQVLECRSRESFETDLQVMLHGFLIEHEDIATSTNTADWTSRIGYSLFTGNVERHDLRKAVAVTLKDSKFIDKEGLALLFKVTFSPVRPSDQSTTLTVTQHATGSRWKFPLRLISHPPLIDDTIVIEGAINKVMGVSFVLKNSAHHRRPFRAFFTRDSPGEFGVHPTHGTLLPDSEMVDGANAFVVTYKATTYGKNVYGTLMIEADDISWSYEIRGVTPKTHNPPTSVEPRYSIISNASSSALKLPAMINGPIRPVPTLPVKEFRAGSEAESNVGGRKNFLRENALMAGRKMR